ncbi:T9SS type B sorting domain-containing protein [Cellulophaga sp. 20_2_10]|uniref:T9SS type B sorting domain-containing protein n=1 Tax=Cellulophaga sp. 20_2_10 TaxID=2942476 RepID=UPI00201B1437|nr:T9SS type B sorting domain-containing protein [Cellulophaga sp. 20_2_10]MCL5244286.1 T9SS type B sorting domain-containing protein [Cellulophaga sp. 20_2_10]
MRFFTYIIFFFFTTVLIAQVTPAEKAALLAFYNATGGPNWKSETDADPTNDWDFSGNVTSDWYGVTVTSGNVVSIDMNPTRNSNAANNLIGFIPPEIEDLSFLRTLRLPAEEDLIGTIPLGLYNITSLVTLDLARNGFSGTMPTEIAQLTNLRTLYLTANEFSGELPIEFTTLNQLQVFNISNNDFSGEIPIAITNMLNLKELNLSNNPFTGYLYPEYGNLINLNLFHFSGNLITGSIPTEFGNLTSLRSLVLGNNDLSGVLPPSLGNLSNLQYMNIFGTGISGSIPPEFGNLTSVNTMYLSSNSLSGAIPSSLGNLIQMNRFSISENQISGELPATLGAWSNVGSFEASGNELTGNIPESFQSFTNIKKLGLASNQMSGALSPLFSSWTTIETLDLQKNSFSGEIPDSYSSFTNLVVLNLGENEFSGELSPSFVNWTNITSIDIRDNELEGVIPDFTSILTADPSGSNGETLEIDGNKFEFGDFEDQFTHYNEQLFGFIYSPQANVNDVENLTSCSGSSITLSTVVSGRANVYQWLKNGTAISGATSADLVLNSLGTADSGTYTCIITSTIVTGLSLERNPIALTVNLTGPTANTISDILACDLDADGFTNFTIDLASIESQVVGLQSGVVVSYLNPNGTPLTLSNNYTNTIPNSQTITVRVTDMGGCYNDTNFNLVATQPITADSKSAVIACDSYILPKLNVGNNYYTETNTNGTQLQAEDIITTTQTIYIHTGIGSCSDETNFRVTIEPALLVDDLEDVTECGVFSLPNIINGNYFTESNGQGLRLSAGDSITETQTIYIFNQRGSCALETSFVVRIDLLACEDSEEAIKSKFPNFFTPNQDGINDVWKVDQELFTLEGIVTIHDRYGKLLKQFNAVNGSWNGTFNGQRLPSADYWYKFTSLDGAIVLTGHFTLKR